MYKIGSKHLAICKESPFKVKQKKAGKVSKMAGRKQVSRLTEATDTPKKQEAEIVVVETTNVDKINDAVKTETFSEKLA